MTEEPFPTAQETEQSSLRPEWLQQLAQGHWRTPVYYEMVSAEAAQFERRGKPTILDIGCGKGFDGELRYQELLAERAGRYIGIEPDRSIDIPNVFTEVFKTSFEEAPIPAASVHIAYAVMVMEHIESPLSFWSRLHEILAPGGVFLGFSVNGAHWFAMVSRLFCLTKLKTRYLNLRYGMRGTNRYEDYPVYYRTNTRTQIMRFAKGFHSVEVVPYGPVGSVAEYAPAILQTAVRAFDGAAYRLRRHRINLIVRAVR